ncbi:helix-turn-helix domain-containing protein [Streptomyces sp. BE230]|uniref:helix-turn-helix domain-containing protein n=1 Tax=Streptomyces sp. BE230 TaxID=3002526 RepID=UPI002ED55669|nr:helix-turn-helix transcriptional regulator [Streptomyces sp. BE230]
MSADLPPDWVLPLRQQIGTTLRAARISAGLTQIQLGELAGIDHKTVHRIEYAASDPSLTMLLRLAAALDMPLTDLVRE